MMNTPVKTTFGDDDRENHGQEVNLPDESTEINLKNLIFRYLKNTVPWVDSDKELIEKKVREMTVGIYEIIVQSKQ